LNAETLLGRCDIFHGIPRRHLPSLAAISLGRSFGKDEVLFLEGQEGHFLFLLVEGHIQLYKDTEDGRQVVIKLVDPGETFAEVVLFEERCYPVSAVALGRSRVLMLPRRGVHHLLAEEAFRKDFIALLAGKLRYLTERIRYLTLEDVEQRFQHFLYVLSRDPRACPWVNAGRYFGNIEMEWKRGSRVMAYIERNIM